MKEDHLRFLYYTLTKKLIQNIIALPSHINAKAVQLVVLRPAVGKTHDLRSDL